MRILSILVIAVLFGCADKDNPEKPDLTPLVIKVVSLDLYPGFAHYGVSLSDARTFYFVDSIGKFTVGDTVKFSKIK
jgi:hypothetical protein